MISFSLISFLSTAYAGTGISMDSAPAQFTNVTSAQFEFSSEHGNYQCSLDNAPFTSCRSPKAYPKLQEGPHRFRVNALGSDGKVVAVVQSRWTIDTVAPVLVFDQKPAATTSSTTAEFSFTGSDSGTGPSSGTCELDGVPLKAIQCVSPVKLSALSIGPHTFKLQAADLAGNSATLIHSWMIALPSNPAP